MLKERLITKIDWDKPGTTAAGFLLSVNRNKFRDGSVGLTYIVRNEIGATLIFKGATQLNYALSPQDVGLWIEVFYVGEDGTKEVREGINRPKIFRVSVDDERTMRVSPSSDPNDPGITDADIPF